MFVFFSSFARVNVDLFDVDYSMVAIVSGTVFVILGSLDDAMYKATYNPVLTIGMLITNKISLWRAFSCILIQLLSGFLAASVLTWSTGNKIFNGIKEKSQIGIPILGQTNVMITYQFTQFEALAVEFCCSVFLTFIYLRLHETQDLQPQMRGLIYGAALTSTMCCAFKVSGACFNPALIFGPSFLSRYITSYQWVYYFGPVLGSIVASSMSAVYHYIIRERSNNRAARSVIKS